MKLVIICSLLTHLATIEFVNAGKPRRSEGYLVKYKEGSKASAQSLLHANSIFNATLIKNYSFGFTAHLNQTSVEQLRASDDVEYVEENLIFSVATPTNIHTQAIQSGATWGLLRISQRTANSSSSYKYPDNAGSGVTAFVVDTGVNIHHVDFAGRASFGVNFVQDGQNTDLHGHGTHVASTLAGETFGVAKKANIVAVRVLDSKGDGLLGDIVAGLDWIYQVVQRSSGKYIINMSLRSLRSRAVDAAVMNLIKFGVPVIVAAGNDAFDACYFSPADVEAAITVAASNIADQFASFSNYGSCVDLIAPGTSF
jgi:subtilisin family serine protease